MIQFEHKIYLLLLLVLPIIVAIYFYQKQQQKKKLQQLGNVDLFLKLMPEKSAQKSNLKFWLYITALFFFIIALANPQVGTKQEKVQRKGIDVVIALDLSKSMLSQDVVPNRLNKAKLLITTLLKKLDGDRVALVVFAGNAYLQMPLTIDYSSLMLYLKTLNTGMIPTQGTAVGEALQQAEEAFKSTEKKHKAIILITDGEDQQEDAIKMAENIADDGTKIFAVGVGTTQGGTIPIYGNNGIIIDQKKDENGEVVISKLNEKMLQDLSNAGKGNYYILDNTKQVADFLAKDISKIETKTIEDKVYTNFASQYFYFIWIGLFFFLIDIFITYKKDKKFKFSDK